MKFKATLSLAIVVIMVVMSSVSALAASYTYSTVYTKDSANEVAIKVTATASGVSVGDQVTYYAKKGDTTVYIDQKEAESSKVDFTYVTKDTTALTQKFGGTGIQAAQSVGSQTGETVSVSVVVKNSGELGFVEVLAQDENLTASDYAPRSFTGFSAEGKVKSVMFTPTEGETIEVPVGACTFVGGVLTVYPAVFTADGTLEVEFDSSEVKANIFLGSALEEAGEYITFGRVLQSDDVVGFGICVSSNEEFANPQKVSDSADSDCTLFPATQVGSDGSFAIGLQDEAATHFAQGMYVTAYYENTNGEIVFAKSSGNIDYKQF